MKTNNLKNTRKMKSFATIAIAALVLMASCSQPDKTAHLKKKFQVKEKWLNIPIWFQLKSQT